MGNISINAMPTPAQKAYKTTNTIRKFTMLIGWIATVFFFILFKKTEDDGIILLSYGSMMIGSAVHVFVHSEFILKKLAKNFGRLRLYACVIWGVCVIVVGPIFLIIDTILFCLKKPLVYPFEHKFFLETKQAQEEM